jgi:hypothetical protein
MADNTFRWVDDQSARLIGGIHGRRIEEGLQRLLRDARGALDPPI